MKIGDFGINFTLPGVDEKSHSFNQYQNKKILIIIFSCNHCPYVQAWEDRIIKIQTDYRKEDVQIIAISSNDVELYPDDSFPKMKERSIKKEYNFPYLFDETQEIALAYGAERTPEFFLFDEERKLRYHGAIDDNYEDEQPYQGTPTPGVIYSVSPDGVTNPFLKNAIESILIGVSPNPEKTTPTGCSIKYRKN